MKHSVDFDSLMPGMTCLVVSEMVGINAVVALLGAVFIGLSIVKAILDIRYHPYFKKRHEQAKRRADNAGRS